MDLQPTVGFTPLICFLAKTFLAKTVERNMDVMYNGISMAKEKVCLNDKKKAFVIEHGFWEWNKNMAKNSKTPYTFLY